MKNILTCALIALSLATVGCAPTMTRTAEVDPELTCGDRTVTVFQTTGFLAVYPEYIDVCTGESITINAVPKVAAGDLRTAPDEGNPGRDDWLRSEGKSEGSVVINVPEDAALGVYKYSITVDGVGTLDPHARVVR